MMSGQLVYQVKKKMTSLIFRVTYPPQKNKNCFIPHRMFKDYLIVKKKKKCFPFAFCHTL